MARYEFVNAGSISSHGRLLIVRTLEESLQRVWRLEKYRSGMQTRYSMAQSELKRYVELQTFCLTDMWTQSAEEATVFKNETHTGPVRGLDFNPIQQNLLATGAIKAEVKYHIPLSRSRTLIQYILPMSISFKYLI